MFYVRPILLGAPSFIISFKIYQFNCNPRPFEIFTPCLMNKIASASRYNFQIIITFLRKYVLCIPSSDMPCLLRVKLYYMLPFLAHPYSNYRPQENCRFYEYIYYSSKCFKFQNVPRNFLSTIKKLSSNLIFKISLHCRCCKILKYYSK